MNFSKKYYEILGVSGNASKEEIRAAYRRLAKEFHPDRNPGNPEAEIRIKEIIEANEVLGNDILREQYDKYLEKEREWKKAIATTTPIQQSNTITRKRQRVSEKRIYIRGKLHVKYWADPEEESFVNREGECVYKVHPNDAEVDIEEKDIFPLAGVPLQYMKAFSASDLFASPLPRPTRCRIISEGKEFFYNLELHDIRVKDIRLGGVTKFEKTNLGELTGDIYAYVIESELVEEEFEEEVAASFAGQTGRTETKEENNTNFSRQEFYYPNGNTYWGDWYKTGTSSVPPHTPVTVETFGCLQWWWLPVVLFFLLRIPGFLPVFGILLVIFLGIGLLSLLTRAIGNLIPVLGGALVVFLLLASLGNIFKPIPRLTLPKNNDYDSVATKREVIEKDTLITHYVRWQSYDSTLYQAKLSIGINDAKISGVQHASMFETRSFYNPQEIYSSMLSFDKDRLGRVTNEFDSIRRNSQLSDLEFAEMIVSCIQSIPYYLVVDRSCSDKYEDDFTKNYLASCKTECCIGQEPFGVRTPAEFIADLKGDCDTRSLLLYYLLSYFRYDVALLTSNYYKHALIAVAVPAFGTALNIYGKNYYMWETTSKGFRPGDVPINIRNTRYWDVSLINKN